jgi:MFS family permease
MFGSSISMFGSRISTIAFPMLVLHLSRSPLAAGLSLFAAIAPSMLVYIPAGALVDRWDPSRVMLASEFGRGIVITFVVVKLALGRPSVYLLILAMVFEEILEIFSTLADRRYVNFLIAQGEASHAQSRIEVRTHTSILAGRPIGPFLFELRPIVPFLADALSFVVSSVSLIYIKIKIKTIAYHRPEQVSRRPLLGDISDGFRWLRGDKYARMTMALMASTTLIAQALIMIFLAEAHAQQLSSVAIGIVLAASGAGGVIGSMAGGRISGLTKSFWLRIQMCAWCAALAFVFVSGGRSVLWIAPAMVIFGFTGAIGNVQFASYIVKHVADGRIARVISIGQVLAIGASALGPALGGGAIQEYGICGAVLLLFFLMLPLVLISFRVPRLEADFLNREEWSELTCVAVEGCREVLRTRLRGSFGLPDGLCRAPDFNDASRPLLTSPGDRDGVARELAGAHS